MKRRLLCALATRLALVFFSLLITYYEPTAATETIAKTVPDRSSRAEITSLPGFDGDIPSKHYGGFITVDRELGNHLYYYFVESEHNPKDDPLVLWLNGGPACSSFDGFVYEHGPFNYDYNNKDVKLAVNPYAWSKVANMIFLDSPAGTGLSYSENVEKYETDDVKTATDLHTAVLKFFELFPEYKTNRFFVAGESYAGIYIPLLVREIVISNELQSAPHVNLIGYIVGNGVTDPIADNQAFPPFAWGKSLMSLNRYEAISEACHGLFWNTTRGSDCLELQKESYVELTSVLNVYNVAGDCERPPPDFLNHDVNEQIITAKRFVAENGLVWPIGAVPETGRIHNWRTATRNEAPCSDYWTAEAWFNREDVRAAIHAAPMDVSGEFLICTDRIHYAKTVRSVFSIHWDLVNLHGLSALIFSGDHDMAVPHTGTELWTKSLGLRELYGWRAWLDNDNQVGGFFVEYDGLTYCTVRNAGHMVPQTHPPQALEMFSRFLKHLSMTKPSTLKSRAIA